MFTYRPLAEYDVPILVLHIGHFCGWAQEPGASLGRGKWGSPVHAADLHTEAALDVGVALARTPLRIRQPAKVDTCSSSVLRARGGNVRPEATSRPGVMDKGVYGCAGRSLSVPELCERQSGLGLYPRQHF